MPLPATSRAGDLVLGLLLLLGAAVGLLRLRGGALDVPFTLVGLILQAVVGLLIVRRTPARRGPSLRDTLLSLPSVLAPALLFPFAGSGRSVLPPLGLVVAGLGLALALVSYLCLGRSFAVLPLPRPLVARGPYRIVRHPAYLGQLLLWCGCVLLHASPWTIALSAVALGATVLRLLLEERAMADEGYAAYRRHVRYRLLPGVW